MVGCPPPVQPVIVPRYTVHERALYFNSTFMLLSNHLFADLPHYPQYTMDLCIGDSVVVDGISGQQASLNGAEGVVKGFVSESTIAVVLGGKAPRTLGVKRKYLLRSEVAAASTPAASLPPFFTPVAPPEIPKEFLDNTTPNIVPKIKQSGRPYSRTLKRSVQGCTVPPGSLKIRYSPGAVLESDAEAAGSHDTVWVTQTVVPSSAAAVPLEWVLNLVVQRYVELNTEQFSLDSDMLHSIVRLDKEKVGGVYSFTPPKPNLPKEVQGLTPQEPPKGVLDDCNIPKYGLLFNKTSSTKISAHPMRFGVLRNFVTSFYDVCKDDLKRMSPEALEELFFRVTLRFASPTLNVCLLHCLSSLRSRGWKAIRTGGCTGEVGYLPIDSFRMHMVEAQRLPAALHYIVSDYGPPEHYRTVELLEDTQQKVMQHYVLVNSGYVVDVSAAAHGATGHRHLGALPKWPAYEEATKSRIRPVCERPETVTEMKSRFESLVDKVVASFKESVV